MTFSIGTFELDGEAAPAIVIDDLVFDVRPRLGPDTTTKDLFADWASSFDKLAAIAETLEPGEGVPLGEVRPLPPISGSPQVWCAGANYYTHTVQMSEMLLRNRPDNDLDEGGIKAEAIAIAERFRDNGQPFVFAGLPGAMCGANDDVVLWGPGVEHDWELEIAAVIGRRAHQVDVEGALDYVAGYTICNDVSTRDVMFRPGFALSDFNMSKNRPTFYPIGPHILPRQFVPNYRDRKLELLLNGEVMQSGSADDLIYSIEELVSYVSHLAVLEPGDILLTGTPSGNAAAHGGRWLKAGDVMEGRVTGLGTQRNRCVADPRDRGFTLDR